MLQIYKADSSENQDDTTPPEFRSPFEPLAEGLAFIRRHLSIMLLTCSVAIVVAVLYLIAAAPTFTANAQLIIDSKAAPGDASSVSTVVESQIAVLRSEGVARIVIQKLGLAKDPEFASQGFSLRMKRAVSRMLGWSKAESEYSLMRYATDSFARKFSAKRAGSTYIVEIAFSSGDPDRAAQILAAVVDTYIMGQMDARYKSALQSERWVKERTNELSSQASAAKKAVADHYKKNEIAGSRGTADAGTSESHATTKMQAELRELEAASDAATRTYDNFLRAQRYLEAMQQQPGSPSVESRLLTEVSRPLTASTPKAGIVLGVSTIGGLLLGIALGMLRDLSKRTSAPAPRSGWRASST
ncbi:Wzz/FepE/Etk N-terminal domain-containing protein [Bradyrhizobium paxllaeri]|uniref:Wzz/FepE/Etk N-terminal domain-containing protein n=1 Tax=Bradyrhizobium paxllaeri TaxID=190148 RepID=UPI000810CEFD|nr:Wzz/FepE/Etk N-terminal domain-containing protein [Bradyrhizobium paxllaeri]